MKLLRDDEAPAPPAVQSYQETQWSGLFVGLGIVGAAAAVIVWPLAAGAWQSPWLFSVLCLCALIMMLIGRFALRTFFASRRPGSWRLRWSSDGLYLRYRSYLNERFPTDTPTVLHMTRREVGWLKVRKEVLKTPDEKGAWSLSRKHRWLEIGVRNVELTPLREALTKEAKLRDSRGGRVNDLPLSITRNGTLRVQLNRPDTAARLLGLDFAVAPSEESRSLSFEKMSPAEKEDHVLALAAAGDTFAAIKAAREVYGFDLGEAKAFVEELQGRGDGAEPGPATPNKGHG
jgi:hypothetical protein